MPGKEILDHLQLDLVLVAPEPGDLVVGLVAAQDAAATAFAWSTAFCTDSSRVMLPAKPLGWLVHSPAAKTVGSPVRPCSSTTIPFSHARPAAAASSRSWAARRSRPRRGVGCPVLAVGHHHGLSSPLFALDPVDPVDPGVQHQLDARLRSPA